MFVIIFMAGGEWVRNSEDLGKFPLLKGGLEILPSLWGRERGLRGRGGVEISKRGQGFNKQTRISLIWYPGVQVSVNFLPYNIKMPRQLNFAKL